ncbi:hypothetical protein R5H32_09625 [Defluviimonas sp. D31]|uniref:hypothetical protein n=1 Tax=Defluviimonas sp. D31 TaxID=3083253 RepID=UPI00296EC9F5|nr:hypothetical protein [Defluviimonas sp. D31]MDW4549610.1 hypothetical protein [Defluviimonas sp. D31]
MSYTFADIRDLLRRASTKPHDLLADVPDVANTHDLAKKLISLEYLVSQAVVVDGYGIDLTEKGRQLLSELKEMPVGTGLLMYSIEKASNETTSIELRPEVRNLIQVWAE